MAHTIFPFFFFSFRTCFKYNMMILKVSESRCASVLRSTWNFNNDFVCVSNFSKDDCPLDHKCHVSGNTNVASRQETRVARMCVGCVPSVLSQTESQSVKTFQHRLLQPHPTTAENVFLRGLLTSYLNDKRHLNGGWIKEGQRYWQALRQCACKYSPTKVVVLKSSRFKQGKVFENTPVVSRCSAFDCHWCAAALQHSHGPVVHPFLPCTSIRW